jgi:hypothetical protein
VYESLQQDVANILIVNYQNYPEWFQVYLPLVLLLGQDLLIDRQAAVERRSMTDRAHSPRLSPVFLDDPTDRRQANARSCEVLFGM